MNSSIFLVSLTFLLYTANAASVVKPNNAGVISFAQPRNEENALEIDVNPSGGTPTRGLLGLSVPSAVGPWTRCESNDTSTLLCAQWGDFAQVVLKDGKDPQRCTRVEWTSNYAREIEDCYDLDPQVHWYGGGEMFTQVWPIDIRPRQEGPYVTADQMADNEGEFGGVVENYWLLSSGAALIIDPNTPLFYSLNTTHPDKVCFKAKDQTPFTKRSPLKMNYEWCTGRDVKETHLFAINSFFEKPVGIPDENMLVRPFWSTWAEFKETINQTIAIDFTKRVISEGFGNSSHIQIDDHWETCYGEEEFNLAKFPDPKAMVDEIKEMGFRVTVWVHPFVNYGCPLFEEGFQKGYFVKSPRGKTGITSWWTWGDGDASKNAGIIDVTNPEAAQWWTDRLRKVQADTGVDSFKFDAGETNWLPSAATLSGDTSMWPQIYSTMHYEHCAQFGGLVEVRTAHLNQKTPIFVRMLDLDSRWENKNGLQSLIPKLLQMGLVGYPFVLPDMIGGNAYSDGLPSKELYVRWMQANIFMPSVQFSLTPWNYDDETVQIVKGVLAQREKYRDDILAAARQTNVDMSPINRPIWWVDPTDPETLTIDNAYMLGDNILVAPVLEEGAVSRDIYLPAGTWISGADSSEVHEGPQWLRDYPAPLNVVPFFVKSG